MTGLLVSLGAVVAVGPLLAAYSRLARSSGLVERSYRDRVLPTAAGVPLVLPLVLLILFMPVPAGIGAAQRLGGATAVALLALGGLLDDVVGRTNRNTVRGWSGHLGVLWRNGQLTSGTWKILFGAAGGGAAAYAFAGGLLDGAVVFALVPLTANTVNLLDVRPGRAVKFSIFIIWVVAGWSTAAAAAPPAVGIGAGLATLLLSEYMTLDLHEKVMLGDCGSNLLGGFVGFFAVFFGGTALRISILILAVMLQIAAEYWSISALVQNSRSLNWLDSLGRYSPAEKTGVEPQEQEEQGARRRI